MLNDKITHPYTNEPVEVFVSNGGLKNTFNMVCKEEQRVFLIHDPMLFTDFFKGVTNEWVRYCLINSNQFFLDEGGIMSEFFIQLN